MHQDERLLTVVDFNDRCIEARRPYRKDEPSESKVLPEFRVSLEDILDD